MALKQGFVLPGGSAPEQLELAVLAEAAGWDAVFVWEGGYAVDAWALLSAMAVKTTRIRLGTMLTPVPWRRPWKLAGQVATLDQLSGGRAILAVGVGAVDPALGTYPEVTDLRERAALLDAGIDTMRALWAGETTAGDVDLSAALRTGPQPVQARIPIWVVAIPGRPKSMRRALRCDGVMSQSDPGGMRALLAWLDDNGGRPEHFDVVTEGETTLEDASAMDPWRGLATWWLESRWTTDDPGEVRRRIEAGPVPSGA
jgi:alkanesulfonate monooxygenase SsuD/methylene tetrahydromethanopterin reductase-like flavin-dependent oxidoreductase (luciferase family)